MAERRKVEAVVLDERHAVLVELEDDGGVWPVDEQTADDLANVRQECRGD